MVVPVPSSRRDVSGRSLALAFRYEPTPLPASPPVLRPVPLTGVYSSAAAVTHTLVKGENLQAMHAMWEHLEGQVDLCLLDPPYNTGNSPASGFTYKDSFRNKTDADRHSTWLTFMHERLVLARGALSSRGVVAVHIDDSEVHRLRMLCDEVFGEANFIAQVVVDGGNPKNNARFISVTHEYLLVYAKSVPALARQAVKWRKRRDGVELLDGEYRRLLAEHGDDYAAVAAGLRQWARTAPIPKRLKVFTMVDARGLHTYADLSAPNAGLRYEVRHPVTGKPVQVPSRGWGLKKERFDELAADDRILWFDDETRQPMRKLYLDVDAEDQVERSVLAYPARTPTHLLQRMLGQRDAFNNPKNLDFVTDVIRLMSPPDALVLDCFAGSGTTGHAVLRLNAEQAGSRRRFILVTKDEAGIFESVTLPRLTAAITGEWADGKPHAALGGNLEVLQVHAPG